MIARPFQTSCHHTLRVPDGQFQVAIRFAPDVTLNPGTVETLSRPFRDLAKMGAWGGMAGEKHRPDLSKLALLEDARLLSHRDLLWSFSATNVDPGIAFVVQNIVHFLSDNVSAVTGLSLHGGLLRDGQAIPESLPSDHEPRPFPILYDVQGTQVLVDVSFVGRHDPADLADFGEAWEAWHSVAVHGGFADDVYLPGTTAIFYDDELRLLSAGIGAVFDEVSIADEGFYCLIGMLQTLHLTLAPIEDVNLE